MTSVFASPEAMIPLLKNDSAISDCDADRLSSFALDFTDLFTSAGGVGGGLAVARGDWLKLWKVDF